MKSISSLSQSISRTVMAIVKPVSFIFSSVWRLVFTLLFIGSLFVNVTMFAWSAGAVALSAVFSAVAGITSIVTDLADSKTRLAASQKQVAALNEKLATSKKQVARMSNRIASRTAKGAVLNVVSVPAEAVPYIGIPVIVAVTGLEIYDACATMEDIKEINRVLNTGADIDAETTCGIKVPDKDTVMKTIQNSPKAAYESAMSLDISLPSWSKVTATTKRAWDGSINGFSSAWDWLFKN